MKQLFIVLALLFGTAVPATSHAASVVRSKSVVKICPSGSVIRPNQKCVILPTQTCYDGTVILTTRTCPVPPSTFSLSGWTANAGSPIVWTITRTSGTVAESVEFKTISGTAVPTTDYTGTDQIVNFASGQATAQVTSATVVDTGHYGVTLNFTASVTYKGSVAATAGSSIVEPASPSDNPTPTPPPATPTDNPMTGQSAGVGAPDIATTDHNVNSDLQSAWDTGAIPGSNAPDFVGAFRFICRHTNAKYDDPTVHPNQPGASHLHDQTGVNEWSAYSNYGNLRTGGGGSGCNDVAGHDHNLSESTFSANRTPYWQPALLDGKGNMILVDYISLYYKRRPLTDPIVSDPSNPQYQGHGVKLPNGLKFIFGAFPENSSKAPDAGLRFQCTNGASGTVYEANDSFAAAVSCAKSHSDGTLEVLLTAPDCWDGMHLDSADHRSHLAFGSYGDWGYYKCDAGHPYVIPAYTYAAFYTIISTDNGDIHFSSDEMDNSKPRGWSFHVDYGPAAWDPTVLQAWEDNCIDLLLNCSGGDLGNGKMLKGAAQPIYYTNGDWSQAWRNPQRLVPIPAHP